MASETSARPPSIDVHPDRRPGVPMEPPPRHAEGAHWDAPEPQPVHEKVLHHTLLDHPTPVFGTAQPPSGLSGALRSLAYSMPEALVRHWLLLLFADRVDVLEHRLRKRSTWVGLAVASSGFLLARRYFRRREAFL